MAYEDHALPHSAASGPAPVIGKGAEVGFAVWEGDVHDDAAKAVLDSILAKIIAAPATEATAAAAKLVLDAIAGKDFATQTTSAAILAKLSDLATASKQDVAKGVLDTIAGKDFASQDTLADVLAALATLVELEGVLGATTDAVVSAGAAGTLSAKLRRLTTDLDALKTELTAVKANQTNGTQKVQLNGSFATLRPMLGATKTASGVASEVFAGAGRLAGRRGISIKNEHPYLRLRIDGAAVTDTTGIALEPFAQAVFALDPAVDVPVYVISEAGLVKYGVVEW